MLMFPIPTHPEFTTSTSTRRSSAPPSSKNMVSRSPASFLPSFRCKSTTAQTQSRVIRHPYDGELDKAWIIEGTNASILNNVDIKGPRDACERVKKRAATNESPVPYATLNIDVTDKPRAPQTSARL